MTKKDVVKYICYATALCSLQVGAVVVSADDVNNAIPTENVPLLTNNQNTTTEENVSETTNQSQILNQTSEVQSVLSDNQSEVDQTTVGLNQNQISNQLTATNDTQNLSAIQLAATGDNGSDSDEPTKPEQVLHTDDYRVDFDNYDDETMERSDWFNGDPFDCRWVPDNTVVNGGTLTLTIDQNNTRAYRYNSAEWRTREFFGYGMYSVRMQPISNPGVVSSFFTYTGPSDNNPWDEIDIEFLGKDTTKVQFNYYTNGVGGHEYLYELGFDASKAYHVYGFDWQADHITWYVDGVAVYTATENLPVTPGKIMMNAWPGIGVDDWLAPFDGQTPLVAYYDWVTYNSNQVKGEEIVETSPQTTIESTAQEVVTSSPVSVASVSAPSLPTSTPVKSSFIVLPKTGERPSQLLTVAGVLVAFLSFLISPFKKNNNHF
ncbi:beta-glucanase [Streptococcus equinus]|uniref:beta-glucanase n=1 Tax=Streptococcus equinus TaxID=1335 RepID=UPI000427896B|nr:family 16 glycosylhydrolase [Streptococcus equinus]